MKQRSASRRKVEYDPVENSIRHINQEVNQTLSDRSEEKQHKTYVNHQYRVDSAFKSKRKQTGEDFASSSQRGEGDRAYSQSFKVRKSQSNVRQNLQNERGFETPASNRFRVTEEDREDMYTPARTPRAGNPENR